MRVDIKLLGILHADTPADGQVELANGESVLHIIEALGIDREFVKTLLINGVLEKDFSRSLQAADQVTLIPPIGGP